MKLHRPLAVVFCLIVSFSVVAQTMVFQGKVIEVLDGSTVVVQTQTKSQFVVKCQAVTTPQPEESFAEVSRQRLSSLVLGQTVSVEYRKPSESGRIVGTIFLNGQDVCLDQIQGGVASFDRESQGELNASTREVYADREARARQSGSGLWARSSALNTAAESSPQVNSPSSSVSDIAPRTTGSTGSTVDVRGYFRKDGTYVAPHKRTAPDGSFDNNWSTVGNVNPYTGKLGTKSWFSRNWWIFPTLGALVGTGFLVRRYSGSSGFGIPCNDGTVSQAQHRQGACSHHGGIR